MKTHRGGPRLPTIPEEEAPAAAPTALHVYYRRYCQEKKGGAGAAKRMKETPVAIADRIHAWIVLLDEDRTYDLFCSIWDAYKRGEVEGADAVIDAMYFVLLHMTSRPEECRARLVALLEPAAKSAWNKKHD